MFLKVTKAVQVYYGSPALVTLSREMHLERRCTGENNGEISELTPEPRFPPPPFPHVLPKVSLAPALALA